MQIALKKLTVTFPANPTIMEGLTEEGKHFRAKYHNGLLKFFLDNEVILEENVIGNEAQDPYTWENFVEHAKNFHILLDTSKVEK